MVDPSKAQPAGEIPSDFFELSKLKGIAKLAAESPLARTKKNVEYFSLPTRSVLNRCSNPEMPFQWTINPYRGCEFGCKYCYARYTHEFMELRQREDFERKIYIKVGAAQILLRELKPAQISGKRIAVGTATDPYQPAEKQFEVTRQLLEVLVRAEGVNFSITTKSNLVLRDLDLLLEASRRNTVRVNLSITTTSTQWAQILEPRAPRPDLRFEAVRKLVERGLKAGVLVMPLLPGITTNPANLELVVQAAFKARAQFLDAGLVYLMPSALQHMLPVIDTNFPGLSQRYRRAFSRSAYLKKSYRDEVLARVARLKEKYEIPGDQREDEAPAYAPDVPSQQLKFEW
ncbi:MAG: radical SAM protein [Acidobacteriia bacterium]|nr:radical SAM protein [Terriglobia bacterium]